MTTEGNRDSIMNFDDIQIVNVESVTSLSKYPLDLDIDHLDIRKQKLGLDRYRQDTDERKLLSHWVVIVVSSWLFLTLLVLAFNHPWCLNLSDVVCCMLLGTTTVNILGLAYIVLKGLFPENKK
jgi:hypothetical protein